MSHDQRRDSSNLKFLVICCFDVAQKLHEKSLISLRKFVKTEKNLEIA